MIDNHSELTRIHDSEILITSRRNALVKRLRYLSSLEGRKKTGMLLLEGTHLLEEVLKISSLPNEIVATDYWIEKHSMLLKSIPKSVHIHRVTQDVLSFALTTKTPDGVASVFPIDELPNFDKKPQFVLALDRLQDPGNMGTLFRIALAADIEIVWLALGADPLSQKVLRSSVGAVLQMPYLRFGSNEKEALDVFSEKLKVACRDGYQVISTVVPNTYESNPVSPYWEIDWSLPTVLVLGNEGKGIHPVINSCCNLWTTLPHSKAIESLNVASVAVPMLLERRRAKMTLGI